MPPLPKRASKIYDCEQCLTYQVLQNLSEQGEKSGLVGAVPYLLGSIKLSLILLSYYCALVGEEVQSDFHCFFQVIQSKLRLTGPSPLVFC